MPFAHVLAQAVVTARYCGSRTFLRHRQLVQLEAEQRCAQRVEAVPHRVPAVHAAGVEHHAQHATAVHAVERAVDARRAEAEAERNALGLRNKAGLQRRLRERRDVLDQRRHGGTSVGAGRDLRARQQPRMQRARVGAAAFAQPARRTPRGAARSLQRIGRAERLVPGQRRLVLGQAQAESVTQVDLVRAHQRAAQAVEADELAFVLRA